MWVEAIMAIFKNFWVWLSGSVLFIVAMLKSLVFTQIRLRTPHAAALYELLNKRGKFFAINREWYKTELPREFRAICWLDKMLFYFDIQERMLRAGHAGTDSPAYVRTFRWKAQKLFDLMVKYETKTDDDIKVFVLDSWYASKIGTLSLHEEPPIPYLLKSQYEDIEEDIRRVLVGELGRTGAMFYGPPGNGKTYAIRYFALKYKLPVYLVTFSPDQTNHDLIRMFSHAKPPCIVFYEDFDSYFTGRKSKMEKCRFTFDTILGVLDGIFTSSTGRINFMTVNDINNVDWALKDRPTRFKFTKFIDNPCEEIRHSIFDGDERLIAKTKGHNLDRILTLRDRIGRNGKERDLIIRETLRRIPQRKIIKKRTKRKTK